MTDLVVIGGGPAGMMCAIQAAQRGLSVTLLDRNLQLGRKLRITGKGRCNVTNDCDTREFMANIPGDGRFLYSAMSRFGTREVMAFFEGLGVPLKVERGNRVFPVSDNANDIADALVRECERLGVRTLRTSARNILRPETGRSAPCRPMRRRSPAGRRPSAPAASAIPRPALTAGAIAWPQSWGTA